MTAIIKVLFTDSPEWPNHADTDRNVNAALRYWPHFRGKPVAIFAHAEKPGQMWKCDTDHVWQVVPEWYDQNGPGIPREGARVMVCRHQIQIGD